MPPELASSRWFKSLPSRQREVLAVAAMDREKTEIRFADIYHSANRFISSPQEYVPVILPRTTLWDFKRQRLLVSAVSQGEPRCVPFSFSVSVSVSV